MPLSTKGASSDFHAEGVRCKVALEEFTENLVSRLALPRSAADVLRRFDASLLSGSVYLHFPFCFCDAFPAVQLDHVRALSLSGVLWMSYMRTQDNTIDTGGHADAVALFLRDIYLRESVHILHSMFPVCSAFWDFYSTYFDEYARAVLREQEHRFPADDVQHYETEYPAIAKGKAAMAKYPVAALAVLSGDSSALPLLCESLDCFHIGYQYWDDLVDWREDLSARQYTPLVAKAMAHLEPEDRTRPPDQLADKVGRIIYYSQLVQQQLDGAACWLDRAYEKSCSASCPAWSANIEKLQTQVSTLATDLRSIASSRTRKCVMVTGT